VVVLHDEAEGISEGQGFVMVGFVFSPGYLVRLTGGYQPVFPKVQQWPEDPDASVFY
jgi:hypothetical protein